MSRTTLPFLFFTCWLCHFSQGKLLSGDTAYRMCLSNSHPVMMDGHRHRCCVLRLRMVPGGCLEPLRLLGLSRMAGRKFKLEWNTWIKGKVLSPLSAVQHQYKTQKDVAVGCRYQMSVSLSLTWCGLYHWTSKVPPKNMHVPTRQMKAALVSDLSNATWLFASAPKLSFLLHFHHGLKKLSLPVS